MKKIVLLGTAYPYRGGLANFNERLSLEFATKEFEIVIYNFKLQYPDFLFPGKSQFSSEPNPLPTNISNVRKVNSINPFNWISVGIELYKLAPDILIFRYWLPFMAPCFSVIAFIAKLNGKTKTISIVDNAIPHEPKFYDIPVTKLFFRVCDKFLAMSQTVINDFKSLTNKECAFHYHPMYDNYGIPVERSTALKNLGLDDRFQYILFFGFIREYKGLDWLLEAMSHPYFKEHNIKLIVAGEFYIDPNPYYELARNLGIENLVVWHTDFIPDHQISNYFCASACVVLPYKHATQSGITQTAYYYQTPIIATDVGGLSELVIHNHTGLLTAPNPNNIAEAMVNFFSNHLRESFSINMSEERKKYTWDSFARKIISVAES